MDYPKMTAVCVCGGCGRTIEKGYIFCPWCGRSRVVSEDCEEAIDSAFERIEEMQIEKKCERLDQMLCRLDDMEKELSALILSTEMHK